jgi:hydrogenase nickel incorporation protein HypA/HybF
VHELATARRIIAAALARAAEGEEVTRVELSLGELDGHGVDALLVHFRQMGQGTAAEGAALEVRRRPPLLRCLACGRATPLSLPVAPCPACGGVRAAPDLRRVLVEAVELRHLATGRTRRVLLGSAADGEPPR